MSNQSRDQVTYLSREAYDRLAGELKDLTTQGRERVSLAIGVAREHGDIRENADYDAAKNEQGMMEARIRQLEELLRTAVVGEPPVTDSAGPGTVVTLDFDGDQERYFLGSREEAIDGLEVLSLRSALGRAVTGQRAGTSFSYATPLGKEVQVRLLKVESRAR